MNTQKNQGLGKNFALCEIACVYCSACEYMENIGDGEMSKLHNMKAIEISVFRAVSSGLKSFDELFGNAAMTEPNIPNNRNQQYYKKP